MVHGRPYRTIQPAHHPQKGLVWDGLGAGQSVFTNIDIKTSSKPLTIEWPLIRISVVWNVVHLDSENCFFSLTGPELKRLERVSSDTNCGGPPPYIPVEPTAVRAQAVGRLARDITTLTVSSRVREVCGASTLGSDNQLNLMLQGGHRKAVCETTALVHEAPQYVMLVSFFPCEHSAAPITAS